VIDAGVSPAPPPFPNRRASEVTVRRFAGTFACRQSSVEAPRLAAIRALCAPYLFPCCNAADFHGWHTFLALELAALARM
jgi:hypothetical protein